MTRDMIREEALDPAQVELLIRLDDVGQMRLAQSRTTNLLRSKGLVASRAHPDGTITVWLTRYGSSVTRSVRRESAPPLLPRRKGILETYGPAEVQR